MLKKTRIIPGLNEMENRKGWKNKILYRIIMTKLSEAKRNGTAQFSLVFDSLLNLSKAYRNVYH
jgi:hypothetical protein